MQIVKLREGEYKNRDPDKAGPAAENIIGLEITRKGKTDQRISSASYCTRENRSTASSAAIFSGSAFGSATVSSTA